MRVTLSFTLHPLNDSEPLSREVITGKIVELVERLPVTVKGKKRFKDGTHYPCFLVTQNVTIEKVTP